MTDLPEIKEYKDAMWSFLLEHCDILPSGTLFVKFHAKGRHDVEKRIRARLVYGYHREDWQAKEQKSVELNQTFQEKRAIKKERWKAMKQKQNGRKN